MSESIKGQFNDAAYTAKAGIAAFDHLFSFAKRPASSDASRQQKSAPASSGKKSII